MITWLLLLSKWIRKSSNQERGDLKACLIVHFSKYPQIITSFLKICCPVSKTRIQSFKIIPSFNHIIFPSLNSVKHTRYFDSRTYQTVAQLDLEHIKENRNMHFWKSLRFPEAKPRILRWQWTACYFPFLRTLVFEIFSKSTISLYALFSTILPSKASVTFIRIDNYRVSSNHDGLSWCASILGTLTMTTKLGRNALKRLSDKIKSNFCILQN